MKVLDTSDYRGQGSYNWAGTHEDEEDGYPLYVARIFSTSLTDVSPLYSPLVMKVRSRAGSEMSGASTPGGGTLKSLSEGDLKKADEALSHVDSRQ